MRLCAWRQRGRCLRPAFVAQSALETHFGEREPASFSALDIRVGLSAVLEDITKWSCWHHNVARLLDFQMLMLAVCLRISRLRACQHCSPRLSLVYPLLADSLDRSTPHPTALAGEVLLSNSASFCRRQSPGFRRAASWTYEGGWSRGRGGGCARTTAVDEGPPRSEEGRYRSAARSSPRGGGAGARAQPRRGARHPRIQVPGCGSGGELGSDPPEPLGYAGLTPPTRISSPAVDVAGLNSYIASRIALFVYGCTVGSWGDWEHMKRDTRTPTVHTGAEKVLYSPIHLGG